MQSLSKEVWSDWLSTSHRIYESLLELYSMPTKAHTNSNLINRNFIYIIFVYIGIYLSFINVARTGSHRA